MKKYISLVVILALVALVTGVACAQPYGDSRIGNVKLLSKAIMSDTQDLNGGGHCHITTSPTSVYRVTFTPTVAGGCVTLYDTAGMTSGNTDSFVTYLSGLGSVKSKGSVVVKADIGEGTANECKQVTYDPPLQFENGVLAGLNKSSAGTIAIIEYRQD